MNKKMSKRQRDMKTKLMAAICMLLVSSIMMVSTTYAWFTLSTAPEVTGINTAVGANGNLEMALMPVNGDVNDITSNVGDSMNVATKLKANTSWGNLVDLAGNYGLEGISLYPSTLNTDAGDGKINTTFPLSTPEYGVDGRVTELVSEAVFGTYENSSFVEMATLTEEGQTTTTANFRGVRAIGTISGASQAMLDYKAALVNASNAAVAATKKVSGALTDNGGALANIAIKHVDGKDSYSAADIASLQALLNGILGTEEAPGALLIVRNAYKEYMVADYISKNSGAEYSATVATIRALTDLSTTDAQQYIPSGMSAMVSALNTSISNAQTAVSKLPTGDGPFDWSQISAVMDSLAKTASMNLNGIAIGELQTQESVDQLFSDVMNHIPLTLYLANGSGILEEIADHTGNFAAPITIPELNVKDYHMTNVKITMQTQSDVDAAGDPHLTQAPGAIAASPTVGATAVQPLSDFYGYVIDLAFRTNVAGSNLQLQTEAVDRIYSENDTNENTMGGGATMIFKSGADDFGSERVIELMKHMKIVLFDPDDGTIIKELVMTNVRNAISVATDGTVTAPLYVAAEDGTPSADATIVALDQNAVKKISVLVYLEGTNLTNADVANALESMDGALNLQFSSSAELKPMEYADLRNGAVQAPDDDNGELNPTISDVTTGTVTGATSATIKHIAVGTTYKLVAVITGDSGLIDGNSNVTVQIGDATATYETFGGQSGWVVAGDAAAPTGAVNVTVTANAVEGG